jgi:hypothetical protein
MCALVSGHDTGRSRPAAILSTAVKNWQVSSDLFRKIVYREFGLEFEDAGW